LEPLFGAKKSPFFNPQSSTKPTGKLPIQHESHVIPKKPSVQLFVQWSQSASAEFPALDKDCMQNKLNCSEKTCMQTAVTSKEKETSIMQLS
jgi:hypothetical protein